jgi:hypothetical protein
MTEPEAIFVHKPVNRRLQEIRLICVIPEANGLIKCKLKHIELHSNQTPDYRALSYTWGAPHPVQRIELNNQPFLVRQNLYDFLKAFRARLYRFQDGGDYGKEVQWLWIDQICIDQSVVEERNHQVEMMSDIYRRASYVYVWLGRSDNCIESVMETIKTYYRRYHNYDPAIRKLGRDKAAGQDKSLTSAPGDKSLANELSGRALQRFFGNSYWLRLWIVQEIMLARYIRVICGETLLSWEELRRFCSSGLKQLPPEVALVVPSQVIWLTQHALSDRQFTYPSLLHVFGTSGCENPRDKVYALQGIVQRESRPIVRYESSVERVFENAVQAMVDSAMQESQVRNGTDLSRINYMGSIRNVFLEAAALWMQELEGVIHLEMVEAWIILRREMGLYPIAGPCARRICLLEDVRALWSRLAHHHLHSFLAKHQPQCTGPDDFEDDKPHDMPDSEYSEILNSQLRNHYETLIKILRNVTTGSHHGRLYYEEHLKTQFGKPRYCHWECYRPAIVHIIP